MQSIQIKEYIERQRFNVNFSLFLLNYNGASSDCTNYRIIRYWTALNDRYSSLILSLSLYVFISFRFSFHWCSLAFHIKTKTTNNSSFIVFNIYVMMAKCLFINTTLISCQRSCYSFIIFLLYFLSLCFFAVFLPLYSTRWWWVTACHFQPKISKIIYVYPVVRGGDINGIAIFFQNFKTYFHCSICLDGRIQAKTLLCECQCYFLSFSIFR